MSATPDFETLVAPLFDLHGKVALVTGGGAGLGRAAGMMLAAAGSRVMLADAPDRIAALATADLPVRVDTIALDVTSEASIDDAVAGLVARHGGIDILVNAAVIHHNRPILETAVAEWDAVQAVNLRSGFLMVRAVVPSMRARGGGRIINVTTMGGVHPVLHGNGAYSASRAGLNQFTKNCALDFAADHITANAVLPGAIMTGSVAPDFCPTGPGADPARHIGGFGQLEDVTGMILLLAGPAGRFVSGQLIAIDGGFLVS